LGLIGPTTLILIQRSVANFSGQIKQGVRIRELGAGKPKTAELFDVTIEKLSVPGVPTTGQEVYTL